MSINVKRALVLVVTLFPILVFAHTGNDGGTHHVLGFAEGFSHPLTGLDHLFAMTLVGVWSAMNTRKWWVAPVLFTSLLLVGALIGMAGVAILAAEHIVAASLLGVGLMVAMQLKLRSAAGALSIGAFAIFHGLAHGAELSPSAAVLSGMVIATALLHLLGLGMGYLLIASKSTIWWPRLIGGCSCVLGLGLLGSLI
ncbi:HupE/UreJ family protein [Brenneria rubrifaciens]|uniref:HupE/UreJ family protein n=1 Tax=Brenneria rubrifaciens TaxID=55213 RepID=A0A4P8R2T6_9GAMM|nr:HupE/UreJ family protein [Brenneria rubrifaciens]QCR10004.1 HupE/UreJ family protein [Brenneria rubrifaciens]